MTKQIVLASGNMGKAREFGEILSPLGIEIHLQTMPPNIARCRP